MTAIGSATFTISETGNNRIAVESGTGHSSS